MARRIIIYLSIFFMTVFAVLLAMSPADAGDFHLIELKEATIGYKSFFPGGYDPQLNGPGGVPNRQLGKQVNLFFNIDVAKYFYFNNRVHGTTEEQVVNGGGNGKGQFRMIGWNFQVGVRPADIFAIEYEHHSQHMLDWDRNGRFPVEDSIGIKVFIFKAKEPSESIF